MSFFQELAAPGVKALTPYQPGKPIEELQRDLGVSNIVKLASNENPLGPSPLAILAMQDQIVETSRYPDGNGYELKLALAQKLNTGSENITLGNGSNDVLELIARAFATDEHEIIFSQYAFAVYPLVTQAINAKAVVTPAVNWGHDLNAMQSAINERTRIIFIANPNNPTGTWLHADALQAFMAEIPRHVIVVVDEAYFEFANDPRMQADNYPNAVTWLEKYPNLIVTRTFSKAYGIAGLRVGYGISNPEIADLLNRVRQPFNVNHLGLIAATAALHDEEYLDRSIQLVCDGLRQLVDGFKRLGLKYIPSVGNFISVDVGHNAAAIYQALLQKGVIVRPVANYNMPNHLRISVGLDEENEKFLRALSEIVNPT